MPESARPQGPVRKANGFSSVEPALLERETPGQARLRERIGRRERAAARRRDKAESRPGGPQRDPRNRHGLDSGDDRARLNLRMRAHWLPLAGHKAGQRRQKRGQEDHELQKRVTPKASPPHIRGVRPFVYAVQD